MKWKLQYSYSKLDQKLFSKTEANPVSSPELVILNTNLMKSLDLDNFEEHDLQILAGNTFLKNSQPISQAYSGHQFGYFNHLGDGRAVLLGEHLTSKNEIFDIQLKGSGPTAYSRRGDGRAALGPMLREYLISEAMFHLQIPTTRSLAVLKTGETIFREAEHPGAILARVASSHIRVGTFEYASATGDINALKQLTDYTIKRHYPFINDGENKYLDFIKAVGKKQAELIANWLHIGFIHGVMNTDNVSIAGESIDYGPCAFMENYDPDTVFSSIDRKGRYAFGNQSTIGYWNMNRFAESLLPLFDIEKNSEDQVLKLQNAVDDYQIKFESFYYEGMSKKLGFKSFESSQKKIIQDLLDLMKKFKADYTNTFRHLSENKKIEQDLFFDPEFIQWRKDWILLLERQTDFESARKEMKKINPWIIPRNHLVEKALSEASTGNLSFLNHLLSALEKPFEENEKYVELTIKENNDSQKEYKTFCGT